MRNQIINRTFTGPSCEYIAPRGWLLIVDPAGLKVEVTAAARVWKKYCEIRHIRYFDLPLVFDFTLTFWFRRPVAIGGWYKQWVCRGNWPTFTRLLEQTSLMILWIPSAYLFLFFYRIELHVLYYTDECSLRNLTNAFWNLIRIAWHYLCLSDPFINMFKIYPMHTHPPIDWRMW